MVWRWGDGEGNQSSPAKVAIRGDWRRMGVAVTVTKDTAHQRTCGRQDIRRGRMRLKKQRRLSLACQIQPSKYGVEKGECNRGPGVPGDNLKRTSL